MSDAYVLGIDQSTQGTKALLLDQSGSLIDKETLPHRQIIDARGYVEHDLAEIYANTCRAVKLLIDRHPEAAARLACTGLSVQRETVSAWQKSTGTPIYHAVVWQCPRGAAFTSLPEVQAQAPRVREITGLELSEFFSAAKITWLADNVPAFNELAAQNDLCVGNMDAYLIYKLTGGKVFATEPSNASRTQLMDIHNFDQEKFNGLHDLVTISEESTTPYPMWTLPEDSLRLHPYIGSYSAHGIVIYRENNPVEMWTVEGLADAGVLKPEMAEKLARCRIARH